MQELRVGENRGQAPDGAPVTCSYSLVTRYVTEPFPMESYGIRVLRKETGEEETVWDIGVCADAVWQLAVSCCRNLVTPCTLRDVIDDWL